jgi:hypothetical protein
VRGILESAPVLVMGQEVFLNSSAFDVRADVIHVLSAKALAPLHFAACMFEEERTPPDCVRAGGTVQAMQWLVPPIFWSVHEGMIHLRFDFFRNGWWVPKQRVEHVPLPMIPSEDELERVDAPRWLEAAAGLAEGRAVQSKDAWTPWWRSRGSSLALIDLLWQRE